MKVMKPGRYGAAATSFVVAIAAAMAWSASASEAEAPPPPRPTGYLGAEHVPDERIVLPDPPANNSAAGKADLAIFRATRKQRGSERWELAIRDNAADPASMYESFSCALGARLKPGDAPTVDRLIRRSMVDTGPIVGPSKDRHERPRPFRRARGEVCIAMTPDFATSGSYPSGHSTVGWLYGLLLSQVAPDRTSQLLGRGRVYGESRVICGVHYLSDIEGGRLAATALMSALHTDAQFQSDLAEARAEFEAVRPQLEAPDAEKCERDRKAIAATPGF